MSPFMPDDIIKNHQIWRKDSDNSASYVMQGEQKLFFLQSGTAALETALKALKLTPNNEVWIVTTSGNRYISGCVTRTIEKYCKWSRQKTTNTAAILVNHEFGFVYREMDKILNYKLPVIEDCAYAMFSSYKGIQAGTRGDFAIYSLAKMFPVQAGGLVWMKNHSPANYNKEDESIQYFKACYQYHIQEKDEIVKQRLQAYAHLENALGNLGLKPRFQISNGEVPGAFVFKAPGWQLDALKTFMQKQGVECSVFYGEEAFYIPCHQRITAHHAEYLATLLKHFKK